MVVIFLTLVDVFESVVSGSLLKNDDIQLVDVRTPEEYSEGHLDRAVNINWYEADFTDQFDKIDKNETIYVYCKAGGRSAMAQEKLNAIGFKKVVNLEGGYDAWKAKNQ